MRLSLLVLFLAFANSSFSQDKNEIPDYGKADKSELMMTECDFDKNAEAVVLFDEGKVQFKPYSNLGNSEISRHIRIKILKNKGLDAANIHLLFRSGDYSEKFDKIDAVTYNLDGSGNIVTSILDKKSIFIKKINKKLSEEAFTFPEVKVGSVIEYSYVETGDYSTGLRNWNFQRDIPVKLSQYTIDCPKELELYSQEFSIFPIDKKTKSENGNKVTTYTMKEVPALRDEPFMTCEHDYLQRIETKPIAFNDITRRINLIGNWVEVINSLLQDFDFGQQLTKYIPRTADLEELL